MEHWENFSLENIIEFHPEYGWITEEWKPFYYIKKGIHFDFSSNYMVSSFGRLKALGNGNSNVGKRIKIRVQCKNGSGYLMVTLNYNNTIIIVLMHRAVCQNFKLNPFCKYTVNHLDSNKTNNNVYNLEWATSSENTIHAFKKGKMKSPSIHKGKFGADHPCSRPVGQYTLDGIFIKRFESITIAKKETKISSILNSCINGYQAGGYMFKYLPKLSINL